MRVKRAFTFEAAHDLPHHPGKCRNLHGHSYRLLVTVDRPVDPKTGLAIDFSELTEIVTREVVEKLDHRYVNEIIENPTAEVMAAWIWRRLVEPLPGLTEVELWETASCAVVVRGE
jgi:6-pyruvoyltetrahydropterin/6-carboxytetrahydropterin synthase